MRALRVQPSQLQTSVDALASEITTLAAHLNAGNYRLLELLAEFDRREGYAGVGIPSCAQWLSWRCGFAPGVAREKVRVARALSALPEISAAMAQGRLGYCVVRALTRVATAENESLLLSLAEQATVSHVEKIVRLQQGLIRSEQLEVANTQHMQREARCFFDEQGFLIVRARLAPEQGAMFMKALQAASDTLREAEDAPRGTSTCEGDDQAAARRADALSLMAEVSLSSDAGAARTHERHLVTVHVAEHVLRDEQADGCCELHVAPHGPLGIPPAMARRLSCDGSLVAIVEDSAGEVVRASRKTRVVPTAMRRALEARDGGCRFPGCPNSRFTDAHHIIHWADGGDTTLENLTLLCRRHHRYVHERGFRIERDGKRLRFVRPDGRCVPDSFAPLGCPSDQGVDLLARAHGELALAIDETTARGQWQGDRPDYSWISQLLYQRTRGMRSS